MHDQGNLIVISGPSGVGKGTIRAALMAKMPELSLSVSVTTRKPRSGEVEGVDYFFVSEEQFKEMIAADEFLEYASVYGNLYGTPKKFVYQEIEKGRDVILEIDIQGAQKVKSKMPGALFIFIMPPSVEELARRLNARGQDTNKAIERRLAECQHEMAQVKHYDYVVVNDDVETAVNKIMAIITAERCRVRSK